MGKPPEITIFKARQHRTELPFSAFYAAHRYVAHYLISENYEHDKYGYARHKACRKFSGRCKALSYAVDYKVYLVG